MTPAQTEALEDIRSKSELYNWEYWHDKLTKFDQQGVLAILGDEHKEELRNDDDGEFTCEVVDFLTNAMIYHTGSLPMTAQIDEHILTLDSLIDGEDDELSKALTPIRDFLNGTAYKGD